jgi:DNA adenine methylase
MGAALRLSHSAIRSAKSLEPFLNWVGGKRRLLPYLLHFLPDDIARRTYHEPFVGAGSLFLALLPRRSVLADANAHLINCYDAIRRRPEQVSRYLIQHQAHSTASYYYEIRDQYNRSGPSAAQAARFIYLNKTCFNGIFRVNEKGTFNVPFGWKTPRLPKREQIRQVSEHLQGSTLLVSSFETSLKAIGKADFAYLDPPYPPISDTSFFTHYTSDRFGEAHQRKLATAVRALARRGAKFMMSNADTPLIRDLYGDYRIFELSVTRFVTCKANKHKEAELIITNYPVRPMING